MKKERIVKDEEKVKNQKAQANSTTERRKKRHPLGMLFSLIVLAITAYAVFNSSTIFNEMKLWTHVGPAKMVTMYKSAKDPNLTTLKDSVWVAGGRIFEVKQKKLRMLDAKGTPVWEKDFHGVRPLVESIGSKFVIADRDTGDIYIIDENGGILSKTLGVGIIKEIKTNRNLMALWIQDDNAIHLMDDSLKPLGIVPIGQTKASAWSFDSIRDQVMINNVDTDENGLISQIQFFDFNGRLIQALTIPKEVVYDMIPNDKGLTVLTDMGVSSYQASDGSKKWQEVFTRPVGNYTRVGGRFIVNANGGANDTDDAEFINSLLAVGMDGKHIFQVQNLDVIPSEVADTGKFVFVTGLKKLYVYNNKGKMTSLVPLQEDLTEIITINANSVLLVYKNHYEVASVSGL